MKCVVKGRGCFNLTCFLKVWWGHVNVLVISHSRCSFCKELFIVHSFLAALGLRCCAWAFCRCVEQGPLAGCDAWVSHLGGFPAVVCRLQEVWRGFSSCGSRALEWEGSVVVAQDLIATRHVGSSWIRDGTPSPALAGGFSTTEPPGKAWVWNF